MSVKIRVSYDTPQELQKVLSALRPLKITWKVMRRKDGAHKNAYGWLRETGGKRKQISPQNLPCERKETMV